MKKLILFAALVAASLVGRAQTLADSIPKHLARTNAEVLRIENDLKTHAALVGVGGAAMLAGTLLSLQGTSEVELGEESGAKLVKTGAWMSAVGIAFIAASFIPLTKKGVTLDGRGLVVHPSELRKK